MNPIRTIFTSTMAYLCEVRRSTIHCFKGIGLGGAIFVICLTVPRMRTTLNSGCDRVQKVAISCSLKNLKGMVRTIIWNDSATPLTKYLHFQKKGLHSPLHGGCTATSEHGRTLEYSWICSAVLTVVCSVIRWGIEVAGSSCLWSFWTLPADIEESGQ